MTISVINESIQRPSPQKNSGKSPLLLLSQPTNLSNTSYFLRMFFFFFVLLVLQLSYSTGMILSCQALG